MSDKEDAIRYRKLRDHADLSDAAYFVVPARSMVNGIGSDALDDLIDRWNPPLNPAECPHEWYMPQARDGEWCRWCGEPKPDE